MSNLITPPFVPQDIQEVSTLIRNLGSNQRHPGGRKNTFSVKKSTFGVKGSQVTVDSYRFQDWDYKRDDLPTYARGIFFAKNEKGQPEIAIRGYDKFFNTDEVQTTQWKNIEEYTKGPYELGLKENGCIIFISGLHDGTLLVCSKHSTGARGDTELSHAMAGERWVDKQLKVLGRTRGDLAKALRKRNATAVAELCDDDFEEHILAYKKDAAGLYLHGININVPEFTTYPGNFVQEFADEWGFKKVDFLMIDEISEVRNFLNSVAETGSYNGRDVEGFVIRCKARFSSGPYQDWFFKYKFEEPYLMYRQWRECTKDLIAGRAPRFKKHIAITEEYLLYARKRLATEKGLSEQYNQNHGIIDLRDDFLKEKNVKGSDIIRKEYAITGGPSRDVDRDVILVPIATIGCGKTTISIALQHLFGWGVVQNDNIMGKGRPPRFTKEVLDQLKEVPVVIADRNNAQKHERKQIIEDVQKQHPTARLIALNFVHTKDTIARIRQITQTRVIARGNNHQTIMAGTDEKKVLGIMDGFINRFEQLNANMAPDDGFDCVINLDPTFETRQNLETVVSQLHDVYPKLFREMPSSEDLDNAIALALNEYKPDLKHDLGQTHRGGPKNDKRNENKQQKFASAAITKKTKPLEYVSVNMPKMHILNALEITFDGQSRNKSIFYHQLQEARRVQAAFHVTLSHRASSKQYPEVWERYSSIHQEAGAAENKLGSCDVQLERVVWDNRIMTIVVRVVDADWTCVNQVPHITVGTRDDSVKPKESNDLLRRWLEVGSGAESGIGDLVIEGNITLKGDVKGVLSR